MTTQQVMNLPEPTSTQNGEHYVWGEVCDGWHLLKESDLSVIQERVPPGKGESRHFHSKARQFFFVISGTATMEFEAGTVTFSAGQGLHVAPGSSHRFVNASQDEVVFIVVSAPTTRGDRTNV
jgi:mannose-6-phosphate isomerase-like protein (cupin superfamily)